MRCDSPPRTRPLASTSRLALLMALALAAGCADGRGLVTVTASVAGTATLSGVDHLTVTATNVAMRSAMAKVPVGGAIPPAVVFSLRFDAGVSGPIHLGISADGLDGTSLGHGETDVTLGPTSPIQAAVVLTAVGPTSWVRLTSGLFGASVHTLALDPKHPATVYAGTEDTGVWVTTDGAASWRPANGGLPRQPVLALALDPVTTTTLYAATGAGVYKTDNSGATWTAINSGPANMATDSFFAIAVDPGHPGYVFAGHNGPRVYRSADGGASWTDVSAGIVNYGPPARSFAIHPSNGTVYVATYGSGLYRMAYNGTSWTPIGGTPLTGTGKYLNAVAYDPGDSQVLYVGGEITPDRLLRTTDSGATWKAVSAPPPAVGALAAYAPVGGGATRWYVGEGGATTETGVYSAPDGVTFSIGSGIGEKVSALAVDPVNAGVAYAATATGVYKTTNGSSWALSVSGLSGNPVKALAIDPQRTTNLYVGMQNAGLFRSTDGASSWSPPAAAGTVPPGQGITALAVDQTNPMLVWAGTGSSAWRSDNGGTSWADGALGQPVTSLQASPGTPGTFYAGSAGNAYVITAATAWMPAGSGLPQQSVVSLAVHPTDTMTVYAGLSGGGVYRTTNGGTAWTAFNAGLPSMQVSAVAIDPATPTRVFAGTDQGVYLSTGAGFTASSTGLTSMEVTAIAIARTNPSVVFAGTEGGGVFRSTDGGASWTAYSAGLSSLAITQLVVDPQDPFVAYAGTWDGGVFKSTH